MWTGAAPSVCRCVPALTANAVTAAPATNTAPAVTKPIVEPRASASAAFDTRAESLVARPR
jgi:hypothetical protein